MRQTLGELRALARELLDDPAGTEFTAPRVDRMLNKAYQQVANTLASLPQPRMLVTVELTPVEGTTAQALPEDAAHVVECLPYEDGKWGEALPLIGYHRRHEANACAIYWYRAVNEANVPASGARTTETVWLGWLTDPPPWEKLGVWYQAMPLTLTADHDEPYLIPQRHQEIVATLAAAYLKGQVNREDGPLGVQFALEMKALMDHEGTGAIHSRKANRI